MAACDECEICGREVRANTSEFDKTDGLLGWLSDTFWYGLLGTFYSSDDYITEDDLSRLRKNDTGSIITKIDKSPNFAKNVLRNYKKSAEYLAEATKTTDISGNPLVQYSAATRPAQPMQLMQRMQLATDTGNIRTFVTLISRKLELIADNSISDQDLSDASLLNNKLLFIQAWCTAYMKKSISPDDLYITDAGTWLARYGEFFIAVLDAYKSFAPGDLVVPSVTEIAHVLNMLGYTGNIVIDIAQQVHKLAVEQSASVFTYGKNNTQPAGLNSEGDDYTRPIEIKVVNDDYRRRASSETPDEPNFTESHDDF